MLILDTNAVSELMRPGPDPAIASWVAERPTSSLFLTAVTDVFSAITCGKKESWRCLDIGHESERGRAATSSYRQVAND